WRDVGILETMGGGSASSSSASDDDEAETQRLFDLLFRAERLRRKSQPADWLIGYRRHLLRASSSIPIR
uniref:Sigma70_r2 domain-containing protein n=1 Tax=Macrostomum lignano TaxID=282301 RepID=A0A1I8F7Q6_9PLAT